MGRRNEQAGLMKQRNVITKRANAGKSHPLGRQLRIGMMLCLALTGLHCLALGVLGQEQPKPWSKSMSIDLTTPQPKSVQYSSAEKTPPKDHTLDFRGNSRDWSLLTFERLPDNIGLKVNGRFDGYEPFEEIKEGKYYPFKTLLPLMIEIKQDAQMPIKIDYWLGSVTTSTLLEQIKAPGFTAGEVRKFAENSNNIQRSIGPQTLYFSWDAQVTASPSPSPSPTSESPTIPPPQVSWVGYLIDEEPLAGIVVLIIGLIVLGILVVYGLPIIAGLFERLQRSRTNGSSGVRETRTSPLASFGNDIGAPTGSAAMQTKQAESRFMVSNPPTDETGWPQGVMTPQHNPGDVIEPPPKTSLAPSFNQPAAFGQPSVPLLKVDAKRLEQIEDKVARLRTTLDEKANRHEQKQLLAAAVADLENKLRHSEEKLDQRLKIATTQLEGMGIDAASQMETTRAELTKQVNEADLRGAQAKEELVGLLKGVIEDVKSVDKRLQTRLSELQTALSLQTVPDSFFNKTLGVVLGQNVEMLQDGNFERLIGEKLNQFFQTGVEHGDKLQDLRIRAEGINAALKDVGTQMEKLNSEASIDARQPMQRVEAFVNELSRLQSQMQSRRATIETTLRVAVSMHAGARQTFLDELGRGIKREIDKLSDPESYFEGEMERVITSDLIAIVDICDKTITPPPGRPELEAALKQLFEKAGLGQILPNQGEAFKTAEQDLVEMAQGSGKSLTVAQVITRGFYYKHRDIETLLRKAGVSVYR